MARTKISEFSATAADNTDIDNIDIAEGCAPSGINNAIRELMAQLKDMQTGASGDTFTFTALNATTANIDGGTVDGATIGGATAAPGTFTTLASNSLTVGGDAISPQTGFRNRIINGDMRIDQRNAGAAVTILGSGYYSVDRFSAVSTQSSKMSWQQSSVVPTGFVNSLLATSLSAYSVLAADAFNIDHRIEGFNVSDLGWGTANASAVTLSFWVRSSLTGTFGGAILNGAGDRSYPFSYAVSSANTFEYKTITIQGDTTGTWLKNNGIGLRLSFGLGVGSTYTGTSGSWQSGLLLSSTGATSVVGTNGATFYITGVQLEKGSTATPFEFRSYGQELALCQRYLPAFIGNAQIFTGSAVSTSQMLGFAYFPVTARARPTGVVISSASHFTVTDYVANNATSTGIAINDASTNSASIISSIGSGVLTNTRTGAIVSNTNSAVLYFTGCEL